MSLLPFLLFALVASITPGPTNVLILGHSARHGARASLPLVLGGSLGAVTLVLVVGFGLGQTLARHPDWQRGLAWAGVLWLSWLAWQLARAGAPEVANDSARLGFGGTAGLQLLNPKSWSLALAVVTVYAEPGVDLWRQVLLLALVFLLVSVPCLGLWALLGRAAARRLKSTRAWRGFNLGMAGLLLVSAWVTVV
ncbi:LysE family translocator [Pseudomonas oryzihabitans]|uniref:LysE family translocator n=1 Tax=Pseudomonas oryzihabitans TaxID=47885 RepID=UPI00286578FF|nr:LysE family translocator [Pseudomonas psychrotolerans]MDR6676727.1 threonine/homoserine/homoserine lactone efflux protein [Pseudomonas psychrotolerans]